MADKEQNDTIELDVFIANLHTHEVHHKNFATGQCRLDGISEPVICESLAQARHVYECDPCGHCFKSKH